MREEELLHDWNRSAQLGELFNAEVLDETLRDGIQSPSAVDPPIEAKLEILHLLDELGVAQLDVGLPGAGPHQREAIRRLAEEKRDQKLKIRLNVACRTVVSDIEPVAGLQQQSGVPLEVYAFIGSSPIRQYAEEWDLAFIEKQSVEAIAFAVKQGLAVTYVTEDTTRSKPEDLKKLFRSAIEAGAKRLCLCDTVGYATPEGAAALVRWVRETVGPQIGLDWHGHNDRGLALANAIAAGAAGATRLHGCAAGIGERVGNTACDQLLVNLKLYGHPIYGPRDMSKLVRFVKLAAEATGHKLPVNYPVCGDDAFRTATGVHAAAIIKAQRKGDRWLADRVYSGVPAGEFGKEQQIEIGPMSGLSNVKHWLARHEIPADEPLAKAVLARAKASNRTLTESEVAQIVHEVRR